MLKLKTYSETYRCPLLQAQMTSHYLCLYDEVSDGDNTARTQHRTAVYIEEGDVSITEGGKEKLLEIIHEFANDIHKLGVQDIKTVGED